MSTITQRFESEASKAMHAAAALRTLAEQAEGVLDAASAITGNDGTDSLADAFLDQATQFGCEEIEKIANLFRAFRLDEVASTIIRVHSEGDEPGDLHHEE